MMSDPGNWRISGSYYESCNCEAICPCRRLDGKRGGPTTFRLCQFLLSWRILTGHAGEVELNGLSVAMAGFYDSEETGSPWTVALYVDEHASDAAFKALSDIFLGRRGGNMRFPKEIGDVVAIRRAQIALDHTKNRERISVRDYGSAEVEHIVEQPGTVTCAIPGHDHPGQESVSRSRVDDQRLVWSYDGRCGFATNFDYHPA